MMMTMMMMSCLRIKEATNMLTIRIITKMTKMMEMTVKITVTIMTKKKMTKMVTMSTRALDKQPPPTHSPGQ